MSAAALILIATRRKRFVRRFREAGAIDQDHAIKLESIGESPSWVFRQMVRRGAFLTAPGERYYMDERAAREFLRASAVRVLAICGVFLFLAIVLSVVLWLCGSFRR